MTITKTTPSGLTGIKLTDMDIVARIKGSRTVFQSITDKGYCWIIDNLTQSTNGMFSVDNEFADEMCQEIEKDGLTIER